MHIHSHKKRNNLDTRAIFIYFLKYVENSGVVVYRGDRFKYSSTDLSDKEKSIVFYLTGGVFSTFSRRLRFTKKNNQNSTEILQEYLAILAAGKLGEERQELLEHKPVNTKNMSGL